MRDTPGLPKNLDKAMKAMDANSWDGDARLRLGGSQSRSEGAFLAALFDGGFGWIVFAVCLVGLAALLVWLYA